MSADKRALDDLDALFRAVPAGAVSSSRPSKKVRNGSTSTGVSAMKPNEGGETGWQAGTHAGTCDAATAVNVVEC